MASLEDRIAALASMTSAQLRVEWRRHFRTDPPQVGRKLLALALASKVQEKELGGLRPPLQRELARLCAQYARRGELAIEPAATLKPGSRLVRNWHGEPHHVTIRENGYLYRDRTYGSLSQIACQITGTNWSGPRFFGLNKSAKRKSGRAKS
ncbi:MAG: DUF2924 domain-containing protein [Parasphingopyxis sp.]|uniref:DUF2924 domain-containing protein n=1 Tax=Parasphingopyxis sp. TaxID=1920299 RepID=UPI0032F016E7